MKQVMLPKCKIFTDTIINNLNTIHIFFILGNGLEPFHMGLWIVSTIMKGTLKRRLALAKKRITQWHKLIVNVTKTENKSKWYYFDIEKKRYVKIDGSLHGINTTD